VTAFGRFLPVATGSYGSRLCENACAVLKSALLRKICQRLVNQQAENLRRNAIFAPVPAIKPAQKRFHTAWVGFCLSTYAAMTDAAHRRHLLRIR
jgi:hypothetical protein